MDPIAKRKLRQQMQRATDQQFWEMMDTYHADAYELGIKHMREAMECTKGITKKQREAVMAKADAILEVWDGVKINDTEFSAIYGRNGVKNARDKNMG